MLHLNKALFNMQKNGKSTDCTFLLKSSEGAEELVHGHKLVLSAASPVFEMMFKKEWANDKNIKITSMTSEDFKILIEAIYTGNIWLSSTEAVINFYNYAKMYELKDVLASVVDFAITDMKKTPNNSLDYANLADLNSDLILFEECRKLFVNNTNSLIADKKFYALIPDVVNYIYSLDPLELSGEKDLIPPLEKYIKKNQETDAQICLKVRPAIKSIRFFRVKDSIIQKTTLLTESEKQFICNVKKRITPNKPCGDLILDEKPRTMTKEVYIQLVNRLSPQIVANLMSKISAKYCWFCNEGHDTLKCSKVRAKYGAQNIDYIYQRVQYYRFDIMQIPDVDLREVIDAFKRISIQYEFGIFVTALDNV